MPNYLNTLQKDTQLYLKTIHDDILSRRNKDFFRPNGMQVYVGHQGQGKTVSMVYHALRLKKRYPRSILVSNLLLTGLLPLHFQTAEELRQAIAHIDPQKEYIYFADGETLKLALVGVNNKFYGVIYAIDEIHTYFNALDSSNIPMYVFTEISQQRKQAKVILGSSQLFLRLAKPFREQCDNIIVCSTHFGVLTIQRAYDGTTIDQDYNGKLSGTIKKTGWFIQTREIRKAFDTYQKVVSGSEQYETSKPIELVAQKSKFLGRK